MKLSVIEEKLLRSRNTATSHHEYFLKNDMSRLGNRDILHLHTKQTRS